MTEKQEAVLQRIQEALDWGHCTETIADLIAMQKTGECQWWIGPKQEGIVITQIRPTARGNVLATLLVAGVWDDAVTLYDKIVEFGRAHGCTDFIAHGRLGWEKVLPKLGFQKTGVIMSLAL